jgi:hypothetical protein
MVKLKITFFDHKITYLKRKLVFVHSIPKIILRRTNGDKIITVATLRDQFGSKLQPMNYHSIIPSSFVILYIYIYIYIYRERERERV